MQLESLSKFFLIFLNLYNFTVRALPDGSSLSSFSSFLKKLTEKNNLLNFCNVKLLIIVNFLLYEKKRCNITEVYFFIYQKREKKKIS